VPIVLLRSSLRRSGSIFIAFEVTTFGSRRGKICHERAISSMSRLTPIYTICSLPYTTFGLGVRHTGLARETGQMAVLLGSLGSTETEYAERGGIIHISRLVPLPGLDREVDQSRNTRRPRHMSSAQYGRPFTFKAEQATWPEDVDFVHDPDALVPPPNLTRLRSGSRQQVSIF
jgi:hypothetical protein